MTVAACSGHYRSVPIPPSDRTLRESVHVLLRASACLILFATSDSNRIFQRFKVAPRANCLLQNELHRTSIYDFWGAIRLRKPQTS